LEEYRLGQATSGAPARLRSCWDTATVISFYYGYYNGWGGKKEWRISS
jgi:hypothetical protein